MGKNVQTVDLIKRDISAEGVKGKNVIKIRIPMFKAAKGCVYNHKMKKNIVGLKIPQYPDEKSIYSFTFDNEEYFVVIKVTNIFMLIKVSTVILFLILVFFIHLSHNSLIEDKYGRYTQEWHDHFWYPADVAGFLGKLCGYYLILYIVARVIYNKKKLQK